ncbi:subtilisin family serine protease [Rheinheimera pacifica]|uniref:S8 family serine peptidase n=1 Tax=Rheinheimera pacifica TaxID=173990 RepID=UPI002866FBBD|nr:S8 family serine peptidase [Rheinheimera pacifica]MDR6981912.1 subtilisin family serine protease [Rheinheimera pacifica]
MKKTLLLAAVLSLSAVAAQPDDGQNKLNYVPKAAQKSLSSRDDNVYFVLFDEPAVATAGIAAKGQLLNAKSTNVQHYAGSLKANQTRVLSRASSHIGEPVQMLFQYQYSVNATAVRVSAQGAAVLAKQPGIKAVVKRQIHYLHTDSGPAYTGAPAIWQSQTGVASKGEGVVVGIMDTGINADHPSFAAIGGDGYQHVNPLGEGNYLGDCQTYSQFCNSKLIGIVSYPDIINAYSLVPVDTVQYPDLGDRLQMGFDFNGHGSHVASTVAGNVLKNIPAYNAVGEESAYLFEQISGMAPHANIVSYQVCLPGNGDDYLAGCLPELLLDAVEHAIVNGVKVLNYSVGGPAESPWRSLEGQVFLNARNFGIHVATSAGNAGPDSETIGSPGNVPWVTTVAAFSHNRAFSAKTLTANGLALSGRSASGAVSATLVNAADYGDADCLTPFAAGTFDGQIVLCRRGEIARVEKGTNVKAGGAAGLVLMNVAGEAASIDDDFHVLPGINLSADDGETLLTWLAANAGQQVSISASELIQDDELGSVAGVFSSRGPGYPYDSYLSPDIAAPGVSIYAAYTPYQPFSNQKNEAPYAFLDGTSMASPHVAGALALIQAVRPHWTPAQAQSALMMTANSQAYKDDELSGNKQQASFFDMGAGMMRVDKAVNAGLLLNESGDNYLAANPELGGNPGELNLASLVQSRCVLTCSWTRTFTATESGSWSTGTATLLGDITLSASPASFSLAEGETQVLTITASSGHTSASKWQFGQLVLSNGNPQQTLTLPVVAEFVAGSGPEQASLTVSSPQGETLLGGFNSGANINQLQPLARGLVKPERYNIQLLAPLSQPYPFEWTMVRENRFVLPLIVTNSTQRVRIKVESTTSPDLDLYIGPDENLDGDVSAFEGTTKLLCMSAGVDSNEICDLLTPAPGVYYIALNNFQGSAPGALDDVSLSVAVISDKDEANLALTVVPHTASQFSLRTGWQLADAEPGDDYVGVIAAETGIGQRFGLTALDIHIAEPVVALGTTQQKVGAGTTLSYQLTLAANNTAAARSVAFSLAVPEGLSLSAIDGAEYSQQAGTITFVLAQAAGAAAKNLTLHFASTPQASGKVHLKANYQLAANQTEVVYAPEVDIIPPLAILINGEAAFSLSGKAGDKVTLLGQTNTPASLNWQQSSGPVVAITQPTAAEISFTLPEVQASQAVVLSLTATDALGQSQTASANISIAAPAKRGGGAMTGWWLVMLLLLRVMPQFKRAG